MKSIHSVEPQYFLITKDFGVANVTREVNSYKMRVVLLKEISLTNFRNYTKRKFKFNQKVNVVVGSNAAGKTNLLEAIYLLSLGDSFKASKIEEMVAFGEELGRVNGVLMEKDERLDTEELEIMVTRGEVAGKRVAKRKFMVGGVAKLRRDFVGLLPVVIFRPEDLELMDGTPSYRRKFIDSCLIQIDSEYTMSLSTYEQALRRRNKLLYAIREGTATRYSLTFWDGLLIKHGQELEKKREKYLSFITDLWSRSELFRELKIVYDKSIISESRLEQYKEEEVQVGYTLVGPHKDDFKVISGENRELSIYGSRGEQRMAVLALKMGEIYYIEEHKKENVLLLLDDIFSELDEVHRSEVLRVMKDRQVVVTSAQKEDGEKFAAAAVISL